MSHFFEAHTTSRLQGAPAACGGLQTCGVTAKMQTLPSLQSASVLHSSAANADDIKDKERIIAVDNKNVLSMVRYPEAEMAVLRNKGRFSALLVHRTLAYAQKFDCGEPFFDIPLTNDGGLRRALPTV